MRYLSAHTEMLRYIFRAHTRFLQNYSVAEFEESDHDDKSLGRAGNIFQNCIIEIIWGDKIDNYKISLNT